MHRSSKGDRVAVPFFDRNLLRLHETIFWQEAEGDSDREVCVAHLRTARDPPAPLAPRNGCFSSCARTSRGRVRPCSSAATGHWGAGVAFEMSLGERKSR